MMSDSRIHKLKKLFAILLVLLVVSALTVYLCDRTIRESASGKLYTAANDIPFNRTGLLLGTSKYLTNGYINPYYEYRLEAATALMKSGKIRYLLISGDNSRKDYSEPEDMRADLILAGIDSSLIYLDYAGFRTFDSMVRLKEIFGQDSVTVISQKFHNERALYIAGREQITAIGYNARDVGRASGLKVKFREKLARVKVFVDYLLGEKPKFLGEKVIIS
jgi:SanA protein